MPVSKKRKKTSNKSKNKNKKVGINNPTLANKLYRVDNTLIENYTFKELIEESKKNVELVKEEFNNIGLRTELLYKRYSIINTLKRIYGKVEPYGTTNVLVIGTGSYKCLIDIHPFIHDTDNTLIISEIHYVTESRNGECIQPLIPITQLADALGIDLVFPAYIEGDPQEYMFNSFGFTDSAYPAEKGQKILLRKSRKSLIEDIININDRVNLSKYLPNEKNKDNMFIEVHDNEYHLCEEKYDSGCGRYMCQTNNNSKDIYSIAQIVYNSSDLGVNEYSCRDGIFNGESEIEDTFKRIYRDYEEFDIGKYNRLFGALLLHEKYDTIRNAIFPF